MRTLLLSAIARCPASGTEAAAAGHKEALRFGFLSEGLPRSAGAEGDAGPSVSSVSPNGRRAAFSPPASPGRRPPSLAPSRPASSPMGAQPSSPSSPHRGGRSWPAASEIWREAAPQPAPDGVEAATAGIDETVAAVERWCFLGTGASGGAQAVDSWPVHE